MPNRSPPVAILTKILIIFTFITIIITFYLKCSFLIVLSGSMEPKISTGSVLCILNDYKKLNNGDIITFSYSDNFDNDNKVNPHFEDSELVTHRIINVISEDGKIVYQTKGDANKDADGRYVHSDQVRGKYLFTIPYMGFFLVYIQNHKYLVLACLLIIFLLKLAKS